MIGELLNAKKNNDWTYLNIDEKVLRSRYKWVKINFPEVNLNYPWAIRNDIQRLFHLCISYQSKEDVLNWIKTNSKMNLNQIHLKMVDSFCYSKDQSNNHIDSLIDKSEIFYLLNFIHSTLERALLWYNPEPCWPSDFFHILTTGKSIIDKTNSPELIITKSLPTKGVDFVSTDEHTHIFYKFQNIYLQLNENKIYSEIRTIAKQSHSALLKSISLFLEGRISSLDEIKFERKLDELMNKETQWCKAIIEKTKYNTV